MLRFSASLGTGWPASAQPRRVLDQRARHLQDERMPVAALGYARADLCLYASWATSDCSNSCRDGPRPELEATRMSSMFRCTSAAMGAVQEPINAKTSQNLWQASTNLDTSTSDPHKSEAAKSVAEACSGLAWIVPSRPFAMDTACRSVPTAWPRAAIRASHRSLGTLCLFRSSSPNQPRPWPLEEAVVSLWPSIAKARAARDSSVGTPSSADIWPMMLKTAEIA
mmetsp:Transcript_39852/g.114218  ORF Transcript_39852/g.114218 Transcript_39852/m.114218 type:complete len:225 (-) Transcript_39852:114-788(-)